jgi:PQQ enzyme repeat
MRHFLSSPVGKSVSGIASRLAIPLSKIGGVGLPARTSCIASLVICICIVLMPSLFAQSLLTSRADNARDNANTNETLLTPTNVNKNGFGRLFSVPVDYVVMAQPLYMPNVNIPGQGTHNVVYVATQADSVYAIDADSGAVLWSASMLNGGTTASGIYLPCGTAAGFAQEGIVGTPVIDPTPNANTMYLVAKTVLNGTVRHHLHALDITTGAEKAGSPVLITATSTSNKGHVTVFNSLHQKNRPGLLLLNGVLYLGFGSNYCNDGNSGWLLSYDVATLTRQAVFNTSPDYGFTSIWQAGVGIAADEAGNIFAETAESGAHGYDVPNGGQTYCNSVIGLSSDLALTSYFTPANVAFLNANDFDLSSTGALVLPDQPGPYPHELIASGKQGIVYVLNRDDLGLYSATDSGVIQEVTLNPATTKDVLFGSPAYWNNTVYFAPNNFPVLAFPLSGGKLGTPLKAGLYVGSHSPSISANGNNDGIMWVISGPILYAFDAVTLRLLYTTNQALNNRDTLPAVGHFVTQTVANGRVYVATKTSLEVYGLFDVAAVTGGNGQSGTVGTNLAFPIRIHISNPYTGQPAVGVTVNFSDGCKVLGSTSCGTFNPTSAVTDVNGNTGTTQYTLPKKAGTYALTFSGSGFGTATATVTAKAGPAVAIVVSSGNKQTGPAGSTLPNPLVVKAQDSYSNGVSGIAVNFSANNGGSLIPISAVTDITGKASTSLKLPTTISTVTVSATSGTFKKASLFEYSAAGAATKIAVTGGNNQTGSHGTQLPQALTVLVTDQYGNPVTGNNVAVSDGGKGGTFANPNPAPTSASGTASQLYTLPSTPGPVSISATATGVTTPAVFSETGN